MVRWCYDGVKGEGGDGNVKGEARNAEETEEERIAGGCVATGGEDEEDQRDVVEYVNRNDSVKGFGLRLDGQERDDDERRTRWCGKGQGRVA